MLFLLGSCVLPPEHVVGINAQVNANMTYLSDIRLYGVSSSNGTAMSGGMMGYLAKEV